MLEDVAVVEGEEEGFDFGEDVLDEGVGVDVLVEGEELLQPGEALYDFEPVVAGLQVGLGEVVEVLDHFGDNGLAGGQVEDAEHRLLHQQVVVRLYVAETHWILKLLVLQLTHLCSVLLLDELIQILDKVVHLPA